MMSRNDGYTIKDIAREAGVAISTVSRYINKSGYVDNATGEKIDLVIKELGYKPNRIAQTLKTKKSRQIMLVVPDICNPFYSSMAKSIQEIVKSRGYTLTLYNTNEDMREEIDSVRTAQNINVDGIILSSINIRDKVITVLKKAGIPAVITNYYKNSPFDSVHGIRGEGTCLSTNHLIELGHKRIAYAGGTIGSEISESRKYGYEKAILEAGLKLSKEYYYELDFTEDSGYLAGKYFSTLKLMPTAICCANDLIAFGVLRALNEKKIKIPEDISVTGLDNIAYTACTYPRLTTVCNDSDVYGRNAAALLFDRLDGKYTGSTREVIIPSKLTVRESTRRIELPPIHDGC